MRQYLKDLTPEEVTERLNKGEVVNYQDSRGDWHTYKYINGICVRWTDGEVDGYGRSIYSTGEAFFDVSDEVYEVADPEEEKLKRYLTIIVKAMKEIQ